MKRRKFMGSLAALLAGPSVAAASPPPLAPPMQLPRPCQWCSVGRDEAVAHLIREGVPEAGVSAWLAGPDITPYSIVLHDRVVYVYSRSCETLHLWSEAYIGPHGLMLMHVRP